MLPGNSFPHCPFGCSCRICVPYLADRKLHLYNYGRLNYIYRLLWSLSYSQHTILERQKGWQVAHIFVRSVYHWHSFPQFRQRAGKHQRPVVHLPCPDTHYLYNNKLPSGVRHLVCLYKNGQCDWLMYRKWPEYRACLWLWQWVTCNTSEPLPAIRLWIYWESPNRLARCQGAFPLVELPAPSVADNFAYHGGKKCRAIETVTEYVHSIFSSMQVQK